MIAREITHTHYHNHPHYWGEPTGTQWKNVNHEHAHRHALDDDHHPVTKEGKDV